MNAIPAKTALPARRPATALSRRRRFHHHSASAALVSAERSGLSGVAIIALISVVALGVFVATALVATALTVVVAKGWQDQTAALIPLALSILIFSGLGTLLRRWVRPRDPR